MKIIKNILKIKIIVFFFQGLSKFLKKKDLNLIDTSTIFRPKGEIAIKNIKKLLSDLNIDDLTVELEEKKNFIK